MAKVKATVVSRRTNYLGGMPGVRGSERVALPLVVTEDAIGWNVKKHMTRWDEIENVTFDAETAKRLRPGAVAFFGPVALLAKKEVRAAHLALLCKDGSVVAYRVLDRSPEDVRAALAPYLEAHGITEPDVQPAPVVTDGHGSVADELRKLAELRDAGILSNEEFDGQKARLLAQ